MTNQSPNDSEPIARPSNPLLTGRWLDWLMLALAGLAWVATPILVGRGFGIEGGYKQTLVALTGLAMAILLLALATRTRFGQTGLNRISQWQAPALPTVLIIGLVLRLLWVWAFPALPSSDGASYLGLAQRLLTEGRYEVAGTRAYWPPGYPFFLAPWLLLFSPKLAILISQLFLYLVGAAGCYKLAQLLSGDQAGRVAAFFFALWPNLIALTGTPEKEALILALLPWICIGVMKPTVLPMAFAGLTLGFAVLVQPSLQFLVLAFLVLIPMLHGWRKLHGALLLVVCAAAVITPWTLRNYQQFGQLVLVSTNGGDNLYRANNPLADGGYTLKGELDYSTYDEVEKDRVAKQHAIEWITQNPTDFLKLVVEKQIRYMGDDAAGVYNTLKRGEGSDNPTAYLMAKLAATAWWLVIWLLIAALAWPLQHRQPSFKVVVWCWLYLFVLHSVFESSGKYHIPMLWVLCAWLGSALTVQPGRAK